MLRRRAFTLFELLIVLVILLLFLAMLLPVVASLRLAAARNQSSLALHRLGIALQGHADVHDGLFPPGVDDEHFSAATKLLPHLEQDTLYRTIDLDKPVDDEANAAARKKEVPTFLSPLDPIRRVKDDWGATNFLFNDQVFFLNSKAKFPHTFSAKGTTNVVVAAETLKGDGQARALDVKRQYVRVEEGELKGIKDDAGVKDFKDDRHVAGDRCASWMDGRFLQGTVNVRLAINDERPDVSCDGTGGVAGLRTLEGSVALCVADGSVRRVTARMAHKTLQWAFDPLTETLPPSDW
jgi:prepilin-type N-terminal cleavage/methylation domain-containing protein